MTGETEDKPSSWTTDTLKSHIDSLLEERDDRYQREFKAQTDSLTSADKRYEQRFLAQEVAVQQALVGQEKAVQAALIASEKAVLKAEAATEARFSSVNEFRSTLADQATTFMPRVEAEQRVSQSAEKIEEIRDSMDDIRTVMGKLISRDVLDALLVSIDRRFEAATKEIQGLRESRSANIGADTEEQRRRRQTNFQIGLMVSGAITISGIIIGVIIHFWH